MDKINNLINKFGDRFRLDLNYYIKNSFYLILAQIASTGIGLLLSISFARFLSKDLFGLWNYIFTIIGILGIFTMPGIGTAITRSIARGHDRTLIEGTKEKFKWSVLGSIVIFGIGSYYFLINSILLGQSLMISSLLFPFYQNLQIYEAFLSAKKQFDKIAKYQVIIQIISITVTVVVIYLTRDLLKILIVYLLSLSLLRGYFFNLTLKNMENESNDKEAVAFGKHLTIQSIPGEITSWGDRIIIGVVLSFPELAIYSIAKAYSTFIRSLMSPLITLSFTKLSEMKENEAYSAVRKKYSYLMLLTIFICGISILLSPYIITLLYTQEYAGAILYSQLLLVALIFGIPTTIFGKALFPAQKKNKELYKFQIFNMIIEVIVMIALVSKFGLLGIVTAKLMSNLFTMIYSWKLAKWI